MLGLSPRSLFHDDLEVLGVDPECFSRRWLRQIFDVSGGNQLVQGRRHPALFDTEFAKSLRQLRQRILKACFGRGRWVFGIRVCGNSRRWRRALATTLRQQ